MSLEVFHFRCAVCSDLLVNGVKMISIMTIKLYRKDWRHNW